jgi:hypothetical protein
MHGQFSLQRGPQTTQLTAPNDGAITLRNLARVHPTYRRRINLPPLNAGVTITVQCLGSGTLLVAQT